MQVESQVKFRSPQNISGASQQNRISAFSSSIRYQMLLTQWTCNHFKRARLTEKRMSITFSNQFGLSGLPETWITLDELHGAISYFLYWLDFTF